MARQRFIYRDGKLVEVKASEPMEYTPFVVPDEFCEPIKHPVTGEIYTSRRKYYKDLSAKGYEIVDSTTDMSKHSTPDYLPEHKILDAIEKAEAIVGDPARHRAFLNECAQHTEDYQRMINGNRRG